jgi:aryl-alcohol dehydrogenase-like predicted oxidoreductase
LENETVSPRNSAKRLVANDVWRSKQKAELENNKACWDRLQDLRCDFSQLEDDFAAALRFTVSVSGMQTAIVGSTNSAHLRQNAEYAEAGLLNEGQLDAIRTQWKGVAHPGGRTDVAA